MPYSYNLNKIILGIINNEASQLLIIINDNKQLLPIFFNILIYHFRFYVVCPTISLKLLGYS